MRSSKWLFKVGGKLFLVFCFLAIILAAFTVDAYAVSFATAPSSEVGLWPSSTVAADLNGDARPDLVVVNSGSNNVSVLLGYGDGTFQSAVNYGVGKSPRSVESGDFNGDGKLDLAVANYGANTVSILLGNGDGTFQVAVDCNMGGKPSSVTTGDLNGDATVDLVVTNGESNDVSVLLGNGDGTFQAAVNYGVGSLPLSARAGDFNDDGKLDLVTANNNSDDISILLGNGDGTFQTAVNYGASSYPNAVATGDFNADGKLDLAVTNSGDGNVSIFLGKGDGTFQAAVHYSVGISAHSVTTGDFNGDGRIDLAVSVSSTWWEYHVLILFGNGNGTFQNFHARTYYAGSGESSLITADFNGDGRADIAVTEMDLNMASVLIGNGDGTFYASMSYYVSGYGYAGQTMAGDFNRDGKIDLATMDGYGVSILLGNDNGSFQEAVSYGAGSPQPMSIVGGDFNGDGKMDLAIAGWHGDGLGSVLLGKGDGTFFGAVTVGLGGGFGYAVATDDFNGDGKADLAFTNYIEAKVAILLGNGNGTFQTPVKYDAVNSPTEIASGDFNNDGKVDLAVANAGAPYVSIFLGNGDGTFQTAVNYGAGGLPWAVAIADLNRDGNPDLGAGNWDNIAVLLGNGDGTFQNAVTYNIKGPSNPSITTADLDGDGVIDLIAADGGGLAVLLGRGDGTFSPALHYSQYQGGAGVSGDFNHDGKPDLAFRGNNSLNILLNNTMLATSPAGMIFPDVVIGNNSDARTFTLKNTAPGPIFIDGLYLTGLDKMDFSVQNDTCTGQSLAAGGECSVDFVFSPKVVGATYATAVVRSRDLPPLPAQIPLRGNGISCPAGSDQLVFQDVPVVYWAEALINTLSCNSITVGCGGGNYCPDGYVTRAEMAAFIVKALGESPADVCNETVFTDVNQATVGSVFCRYIEKFNTLGITVGCGDGTAYCPYDLVTRAQMAVFLTKALKETAGPCLGTVFNDVSSSLGGFCGYVEKFATLGITAGCVADDPATSNNEAWYCPYQAVTRAQMAVFLTKAFLE